MANAYHTQDLVKGVLQKCGENTDGSSTFHELALKYINVVYQGILSGSNEFIGDTGHSWRWAKSTGSFIVKAYYSTGTASVTNGSANGTFSSAPTVSQAGRHIKFDDRATFYEILSHTASSTAFVLKTPYVEATATGLSFKSMPLSYELIAAASLPRGICRLLEPFNIYIDRGLEYLETGSDQGKIYGVDIDQFREKFPLRQIENGVASRFTTDTRTDTTWNILINKFATDDFKVDFDYVAIQDDLVDSSTSIPVLPREFKICLEYGASHYLCMDKEEDKKGTYYFGIAKAKLEALHSSDSRTDKNTSKGYGRLVPRLDETSRPWWLIGRT